MSHFQTLRTKLTDGKILEASLRELGLHVKTNATVRGANDQRAHADIVAVLEGGYDIGWSRNAAGSFDLIADLWGAARKHNQAELVSAVNQRYALKRTLAEIKQPGLQKANVKLAVQS